MEMTLVEKLKRYKELKQELEQLEADILMEGEQTLAVGESFKTPFGVILENYRGRGSYDYEALAKNELVLTEDLMENFTKKTVDWTALVKSFNLSDDILSKYYHTGSSKIRIVIKG